MFPVIERIDTNEDVEKISSENVSVEIPKCLQLKKSDKFAIKICKSKPNVQSIKCDVIMHGVVYDCSETQTHISCGGLICSIPKTKTSNLDKGEKVWVCISSSATANKRRLKD